MRCGPIILATVLGPAGFGTALGSPAEEAVARTPEEATTVIRREGRGIADQAERRVSHALDLHQQLFRGDTAAWLVALRPGHAAEELSEQLPEGLRVERSWPKLGMVRVRGDQSAGAADALTRLPAVESAEPDRPIFLSRMASDPQFTRQWTLRAQGSGSVVGDADIDATEAWDITTGASPVVVAVLDTGIDPDHPELVDRLWRNNGEVPDNGVDDDGNGVIDDVWGYDALDHSGQPLDLDGHGTACASIIGASPNNAVLMAPIAWNARIMPIRIIGPDRSTFVSDAIAGIEYAVANGAQVLSNSWRLYDHSPALEEAVRRVGEEGVVFVAGAGNEGGDNDLFPAYPASFGHDHVISVAGVDRRDELADYPGYWRTNYGLQSVDIAAPTEGVLAAAPGGGWTWLGGTSAATPIVAGVAALLRSYHPELTPEEIRELLMAGAEPLPALSGLIGSGGRVNARNALRLAALPISVDLPRVVLPSNLTLEAGRARRLTAELSGDVSEVRWDLGDGAGMRSGGPTVELRYGLPGKYRVAIEVLNGDGLASHASTVINVPGTWVSVAEDFASEHPYTSETLLERSWTIPGARFVRARVRQLEGATLGPRFPDRYEDGLVVLDEDGVVVASYSGSEGSFFTEPVRGDTFSLLFNGRLGGRYGFEVDAIEYLPGGEASPPASEAGCRASGQVPSFAGLLLLAWAPLLRRRRGRETGRRDGLR